VGTGVSASQLVGTEASLATKLASKADQTALNTVQDVAGDALALAQQNQSMFDALSISPITWLESPAYNLDTHPDGRYVVAWEHGQFSEPLMAQLFVRATKDRVTYIYPYTDYKVQMRYSRDDLRGRTMNRLLLSFQGNDLVADPSYRIVNILVQDRFNSSIVIVSETLTNASKTDGVITPITPTLLSTVEYTWNNTSVINRIHITGEHLRRNNAQLTVSAYWFAEVIFSEIDPSWITTSAFLCTHVA
jgi:hypothetical protein